MSEQIADKRGYLNDNFRLFHLKDRHTKPIDFHYHEFLKVVIFYSGDVTYIIEGKNYKLCPYDTLFINYHEIHCPMITENCPYERVILWINRDYLMKEHAELARCFLNYTDTGNHLLRLSPTNKTELMQLVSELETSLNTHEFAGELLSDLLFLRLMVYLNRWSQAAVKKGTDLSLAISNPTIDALISYITSNIGGNLSIDALSKEFYLSPSYLMHKFKETTGSSLHTYITQKRIFSALEMIRNGESITNAAALSGFNEYTTFLRTFRKLYRCTPSEFLKQDTAGLPQTVTGLRE